MNSGVHPSSCVHIVKASDNYMELRKERHVKLLNFSCVVIDLHSRTSLHYELSSNLGLVLPHIFLSEEELPVKVRDINGI
jgi:hypothetical protein